jgi:hypothetical protein
MPKKLFLIPVLLALVFDSAAFADNCRRTSASLSQYVNCKVSAMAILEIQETDHSKQTEANSAAVNSTTLADRSTGPDFMSTSLAFPGLASKSSVPNSTDYSIGVSMYAFYSLLRTKNPFDPDFYSENTSQWRRVSFNFVDSYPADKTSTISGGSRTYGTTFLLHGSRDVGDPSNKGKFASLNQQIGAASGDFATIYHEILNYLFKYSLERDFGKFIDAMESPDSFRAIANRLSSEDERQIERIIGNRITSQVVLMKTINRVVENIKQTPQFSTLFTSRISKGTSPNLYRFGFVYDFGVIEHLNSTTNFTYDFINAQQPGAMDRHVFRLVQQFQYVALSTHTFPKRTVATIAGSGEGDWGSDGAPVYRANAKLTLSAMAGVDFPLSFTYTSLIPSTRKSDVKFQAALAFDFSKIARALAH